MLRVLVEYIPQGTEEGRHVIAKGEILVDTETKPGTFHYTLCRTDKIAKVESGSIRGYRGLEKDAWPLVFECLKDTYEG
jgi:hypothetical protein